MGRTSKLSIGGKRLGRKRSKESHVKQSVPKRKLNKIPLKYRVLHRFGLHSSSCKLKVLESKLTYRAYYHTGGGEGAFCIICGKELKRVY